MRYLLEVTLFVNTNIHLQRFLSRVTGITKDRPPPLLFPANQAHAAPYAVPGIAYTAARYDLAAPAGSNWENASAPRVRAARPTGARQPMTGAPSHALRRRGRSLPGWMKPEPC